MKQYEKSIIAIMLAATLFLSASPFLMSANVSAQTTSTVRGKIERKGDKKIYPAAYVRVTLTPQGKSTSRISVYTGADGMYYFRNVALGAYILEVWNAESKAIRRYHIKADREYIDVAPILID